jgi:hypothetical protein
MVSMTLVVNLGEIGRQRATIYGSTITVIVILFSFCHPSFVVGEGVEILVVMLCGV